MKQRLFAKLYFRKKCFLKFDDSYSIENNTISAYVYLKNKIFINANLIKLGLAVPNNSLNHKYKEKFLSFGRRNKMPKEWSLNMATNRWGLNKQKSVGPTSKWIRECDPKTAKEWEKFYFNKLKNFWIIKKSHYPPKNT